MQFDPTKQLISSLPPSYISFDGRNYIARSTSKPTWTIMRIVHWYKYPNERLSSIRNCFDGAVKWLSNNANASSAEIQTLRANIEFLNGKIEKHNSCFLTRFFQDEMVSKIDFRALDYREESLVRIACNECCDDIVMNFSNLHKAAANDAFEFEPPQADKLNRVKNSPELPSSQKLKVDQLILLEGTFQQLKALAVETKKDNIFDPVEKLANLRSIIQTFNHNVDLSFLDSSEKRVITNAVDEFASRVSQRCSE